MTPRADRPPSRRALASAGLVVVGCLGLFVLIAEDVLDGGGLISRDEAALSWFVDHRTDPLITAARWVSTLGGFIALCVIGIALRATTVGLASFPSAHATYAAAFFIAAALTLALTSARERWEKPVLLAGGAALAGLVGVSRLVLAVHWLSDVIAGWALGTAVAVTVVMLAWYGTTRTASRRTDQPAVPT
jgi:membrane-associated phospholipid phosphatase